jgi:predicted CDP-diglyceride synthetase/phosphatidate cytidylyltransferase
MTKEIVLIVLFFGGVSSVLATLSYLYWRKDHLFMKAYEKRNLTMDSKIVGGVTSRHLHRVSSVIFGLMAALFLISGVLATIEKFGVR